MQSKNNCWDYHDLGARVKSPIIELMVQVRENKRFLFQIDTGFDGELLVPEKIYFDLGLTNYELPPDLWAFGESIKGDFVVLRSSKAKITNENLGFEHIAEIETFKGNKEFLVGTKFLKMFKTFLDGFNEQVCFST